MNDINITKLFDDLCKIVKARGTLSSYEDRPKHHDVIRSVCSHPKLRYISHGFFSVVAEHVDYPSVVIKISSNLDDKWLNFASYAQANSHNKHLPKIYCVQRGGGMYIAVMEKLENPHYSTWFPAHSQYSTINIVENTLNKDSMPSRIIFDIGQIITTIQHSSNIVSVYWQTHHRWSPIQFYRIRNLIKTIRDIKKTFVYDKLDLHDGNMMCRKDGTVVITDPIF